MKHYNEQSLGDLSFLFKEARQFRDSEYFQRMINFSARMAHLKPFNAMLAYNQMPGAKYVLYPEVWKNEHNRLIKIDARPIVILNFKPVGYVFDLYDTYPDPDYPKDKNERELSDDELLWNIENQFDAEFIDNNNNIDIDQLYHNLNINGIDINDSLDAGAGYGGHCRLLNETNYKTIQYTTQNSIVWSLPFIISVNKNAKSKGELISTITHELGHLLCQHLPCPHNWTKKNKKRTFDQPEYKAAWEQRNISYEAGEIEAESVAYLVCSRLRIKTKSAQYLANFVENNKEIPDDVSYEHIFKAANKVMDFFDYMSYKDAMLYKYDLHFQHSC